MHTIREKKWYFVGQKYKRKMLLKPSPVLKGHISPV